MSCSSCFVTYDFEMDSFSFSIFDAILADLSMIFFSFPV